MKASVKLGSLQIGVIVLTLITAVIHLTLLFPDVLFILNGLGYLGLLAGLYFLPQLAGQRSLIRWAFIGYTVLTITLFFVMNPERPPLGLFTKAVEVVLAVLLYLDGKR